MPKNFKAIFTEAEENYKLGRVETANELIELGLRICNELQNKRIPISIYNFKRAEY